MIAKPAATPIKAPTDKQRIGQAAEDAAAVLLQQQGLQLIERNFSCKMGEIDLILQDSAQLVFVEVRFRKNQLFGGAAASVNLAKQKKLQKTAYFYMNRWQQLPACRFDVLAMTFDSNQQIICENWIKNAF
ncbi:MAG TPA: YraN family protein [Marinospirillum sp.]|uniref:YraN family protein n=1 Tax=Marinospirillum sp. TaxID=2183934 RepID=UPI002B47B7E6|nr:YraN family protein [Marinospirillum sp.]HKM15460.1 YraN family protein [Marinospirillum sp.]